MKRIITICLVIACAGFTMISCSKHDNPNQKTIVLVHGAFQAAYAWQYVKPQLEAKGYKVIAIDLPGHGADLSAPQTLSIDVYRDKVASAINAIPGKVVLVGHSMGGMVISAVAEKIPDHIEKLVYIGAFLPANGQSLYDLAATDAQSLFGPSIIPSQDMLTFDLPKESVVPIFIADGSDEVKNLVLSNYKAEPAIPFINKVNLSASAFGSVDKYYVHTLQDKAVGLELQKKMVAAAGVSKVYTVNSSHSPFLSVPSQVTSILVDIAK